MVAKATQIEQPGRRATVLAVAGLMLALFLVALDQTVVGTALPKIIADLNGFEHYAWVTTAYLLASTSMIPVIGKLGDIYGRKWFIISGVAIFLAASALCGAAWGMTELILFRGLQGLGAGMIFSNIFTSVADIFPDPACRAKYQGVFFSVFALTSVIGPTMGGWITDNLSWRWGFYINLPLGVFSLFALPVVLHQSTRRLGVKIDYLGAATITTSVVSLLLALSWVGEGYDWDASRVVIGFVVAGILFAAFIPLELKANEPVIPLSLFKSRVFSSAALLMFMVGIAMFGVILYTPLFVQGVLGKTDTGSGAVLTPLVLTMTAMEVIAGQVIARVKRIKPFMIVGVIVMGFGIYLLTTLDTHSTQTTVALYLMVTGLGLGPLMPTATLAVQLGPRCLPKGHPAAAGPGSTHKRPRRPQRAREREGPRRPRPRRLGGPRRRATGESDPAGRARRPLELHPRWLRLHPRCHRFRARRGISHEEHSPGGAGGECS